MGRRNIAEDLGDFLIDDGDEVVGDEEFDADASDDSSDDEPSDVDVVKANADNTVEFELADLHLDLEPPHAANSLATPNSYNSPDHRLSQHATLPSKRKRTQSSKSRILRKRPRVDYYIPPPDFFTDEDDLLPSTPAKRPRKTVNNNDEDDEDADGRRGANTMAWLDNGVGSEDEELPIRHTLPSYTKTTTAKSKPERNRPTETCESEPRSLQGRMKMDFILNREAVNEPKQEVEIEPVRVKRDVRSKVKAEQQPPVTPKLEKEIVDLTMSDDGEVVRPLFPDTPESSDSGGHCNNTKLHVGDSFQDFLTTPNRLNPVHCSLLGSQQADSSVTSSTDTIALAGRLLTITTSHNLQHTHPISDLAYAYQALTSTYHALTSTFAHPGLLDSPSSPDPRATAITDLEIITKKTVQYLRTRIRRNVQYLNNREAEVAKGIANSEWGVEQFVALIERVPLVVRGRMLGSQEV